MISFLHLTVQKKQSQIVHTCALQCSLCVGHSKLPQVHCAHTCMSFGGSGTFHFAKWYMCNMLALWYPLSIWLSWIAQVQQAWPCLLYPFHLVEKCKAHTHAPCSTIYASAMRILLQPTCPAATSASKQFNSCPIYSHRLQTTDTSKHVY